MKLNNISIAAFASLLLALFLPIFLCVVFIGNDMNYNPDHKIYVPLGNKVLFGLILIGVFVFIVIINFLRRVAYTRRTVIGCIAFSVIVSIVFYLVNIEISKCIAFYGAWDCGMVANSARWVYEGKGLQYGDYYYIFTNNVPITWLLHKLYSFSIELSDYSYNPEFIWIQFQCAQHALAVLLSAMTVLIMSKNISCTICTLLVNAVLLTLSPWKIIPYTDASTIAFPVATFFLYAIFLKVKSGWKYAIWLLLTFVGIIGGVFKATCYVVLIAIVIVDFLWIILENERLAIKLKRLLFRSALLICSFWLVSYCKEGMYSTLDYKYNYDMDMGWIPFLYDGLSEEDTGACSADGLEMVRAQAGASREERNVYEWNKVKERIEEKGFMGLLNFWLRKQVMTYNDGTFSWYQEGHFNTWEYEELTDNRWKEHMRAFFWKDGEQYSKFTFLSQGIWFFVLLGVIGEAVMILINVIRNRKEDEEYSNEMRISNAAILHFIGIFLFLMLFEGRARYLYNSVAVFATMAVMGYHKIAEFVFTFMDKRKAKTKNIEAIE